MRAYKWLDIGASDPFEEFSWPLPEGGPGAWVRMSPRFRRVRPTLETPPQYLPVDVAAELWETELEAEEHGIYLRAKRGRLVRRIDSWTEESASSFRSTLSRGRLPRTWGCAHGSA